MNRAGISCVAMDTSAFTLRSSLMTCDMPLPAEALAMIDRLYSVDRMISSQLEKRR